jgi:hypothetical protein
MGTSYLFLLLFRPLLHPSQNSVDRWEETRAFSLGSLLAPCNRRATDQKRIWERDQPSPTSCKMQKINQEENPPRILWTPSVHDIIPCWLTDGKQSWCPDQGVEPLRQAPFVGEDNPSFFSCHRAILKRLVDRWEAPVSFSTEKGFPR